MTDINWLGTTPLGKITAFDDNKSANITPVSFPGQDSGKTEGIDTLGITAYFNIRGYFIGKFEDIQGYIYNIKNIADGRQISSRELKSPFINSNFFVGTTKYRRQGSIGEITGCTVPYNILTDSTANFQTWGIQPDDLVKNLLTGEVAAVDTVDSETQLTLKSYGGGSANIFPDLNTNYAVTATINVKVISFEVHWEVPGLTYCNYTLSVMQVS